MYQVFHKYLYNLKCISGAANDHIRLISEGWSYDADNSAVHRKNTLQFKTHSSTIFFFQINAALVISYKNQYRKQ